MTKTRTILGLAAFAALGGSIAYGLLSEAKAARDAELLAEIQRAEETVSFVGRRTIAAEGVTTVLDVAGRGGLRRVKLVEGRADKRKTPDGPFAFIDRFGSLAGGHAGHMARFGDSALILENYRLVRAGRETVAGRDADCFELRARRAGRASYRLWADAQNRMLLRFQVVGAPFDMSHEAISFDPDWTAVKPPVAATRPEGPFKIKWESLTTDDLRGLNFKAWLPSRPPTGFRLRALESISAKVIGSALQAWYSDGMASITVFEFPANLRIWQLARPRFFSALGPVEENVARRFTVAGGTIMNVTLEGTEVFVAGQLAPDEMERVVKSLKKAN